MEQCQFFSEWFVFNTVQLMCISVCTLHWLFNWSSLMMHFPVMTTVWFPDPELMSLLKHSTEQLTWMERWNWGGKLKVVLYVNYILNSQPHLAVWSWHFRKCRLWKRQHLKAEVCNYYFIIFAKIIIMIWQ